MLETQKMVDSNLILPDKIFFTGVPGSRWSGISQEIKKTPGFNTSDLNQYRNYQHSEFSGHCGAYFGTGMEFSCNLSETNLNAPFSSSKGTKLLLSHEWPFYFSDIIDNYPNAWIQLVYRDNLESFNWWKQAGGFDIKYPNYDWFENETIMLEKIIEINKLILNFGQKHNLKWCQHHKHADVFITTFKP
jgi:hypothetical protein